MASTFHLSKARNELADTKSCCDARGEKKKKKKKGGRKILFPFAALFLLSVVFFSLSGELCRIL